ncbi:zinc metalloproteinase nas-7-like [Haematobia irritans]|uniref:zinc metalloproteinase nas-7-like n=1 Tax=Haematobia irritans TaxID=7368 RepID=UPI003F4FEAA5
MVVLSGCFSHIGILSVVFVTTWSAPLDYSNDKEYGTRLADSLLVDDMIISLTRNGAINPSLKWPNGIVYYKISSVYDSNFVVNIMTAMNTLESVSCIRFVEANETTIAYVNIISEVAGCNAGVGHSGRTQRLNLDINAPKCGKVVTIMHEPLHALGFYHQHMSYDRDNYVTIHWENITPGKKFCFQKLDKLTVTSYGYPYDYDSIMHYGKMAFSVNNLPTITPHDSSATISKRVALSPIDIGKLNAMYNCPMATTTRAVEPLGLTEENLYDYRSINDL